MKSLKVLVVGLVVLVNSTVAGLTRTFPFFQPYVAPDEAITVMIPPPTALTAAQRPSLKTYQSPHRFAFSYPQSWLLNDASPDSVTLFPNTDNPYQNIIFAYVAEPIPLGQAIVCDPPTRTRKRLQSGQDTLWVEQTGCILGEDRDQYGPGSSIESDIRLDDGHYLHVLANSTRKPIDETAKIQIVLNSLILN